jgi:hypothetical protein
MKRASRGRARRTDTLDSDWPYDDEDERRADEDATLALETLLYPDAIEERAGHEIGHAASAILMGGLVASVTLHRCTVGFWGWQLDTHLRLCMAGLAAPFSLGTRKFLSPGCELYLESIRSVRSGDVRGTHDLRNFFGLLLDHYPDLSDADLVLRANLELALCDQHFRDVLPWMRRCRTELIRRRSLSNAELCGLW